MQLVDRNYIRTYFKDKWICILGSAPNILNNRGEDIDSYDIIVRMNNYRIGDFKKWVGTRTDVYYSYFGNAIKKTRWDLEHDGVKLFMSKVPDYDFTDHNNGIEKTGYACNFKRFIENARQMATAPLYIPQLKDFKNKFILLNAIPTTGFAAILDVLDCEPKEVFVGGFDFFESRKHNIDQEWRNGDGGHALSQEKAIYEEFLKIGKIRTK